MEEVKKTLMSTFLIPGAGFSKFVPISLNPYNMGGVEVKNHIA